MVKCSRCPDEITRDRTNLSFIIERQDFPPDGEWQESVDRHLSGLCPNCAEKLIQDVHILFRSL